MAGNLSPSGRHHERHGRGSRRESGGGGGGFLKNLFGGGRRDKHHQQQQQQQQQQQHPQHQQQHPYPDPHGSPPPPAPPPATFSPGAKLRALLSFAPQNPSRNPSPAQARGGSAAPGGPPLAPGPGGPPLAPGPGGGGGMSEMQVKDLQHRNQLLQAQLQNLEAVKQALAQEQRTAAEWKEKWNYQNFKLNLMVDMLVLRVLELEPPPAAAPARA